jgi:hypothetical protein
VKLEKHHYFFNSYQENNKNLSSQVHCFKWHEKSKKKKKKKKKNKKKKKKN